MTTEARPAATDASGSSADAGGGDLMASALEFARSWAALIESEVALARRSLRALLTVALVLPMVVLGIWLGANTLLVAVAHSAGFGWLGAAALGLGFQLLVLLWLLIGARRWLHDLSLQRSRDLLLQVLGPPQ